MKEILLLLGGTRSGAVKCAAAGLVILLLCAALEPQPAYGQLGLLPGLTKVFNQVNSVARNILGFINSTMRPVLETIQSAATGIQSFMNRTRQLRETIVWPLDAINGAKNLARQLIGLFRGQLNALYSIAVNSAQLPNPVGLETAMRNGQVRDEAQLKDAFERTFGPVPAVTDAHPEERNLIDVDDALAKDQLMLLKIADAAAERTVAAAERIEDEATRTAPGTAAFLSASAYLAALQSQAHLQKMIAGQMRQEAARLAHDTMMLKRGAAFAVESREKAGELNR